MSKFISKRNETFSEVANNILRQLGGDQFLYLVGVRSVMAFADGVAVRFTGKAKDGINNVRVTLDADDTYTVAFQRSTVSSLVNKGEFSGVYADMLANLFESETGLYVSLHPLLGSFRPTPSPDIFPRR